MKHYSNKDYSCQQNVARQMEESSGLEQRAKIQAIMSQA
jgi:hypothetical protein